MFHNESFYVISFWFIILTFQEDEGKLVKATLNESTQVLVRPYCFSFWFYISSSNLFSIMTEHCNVLTLF